MAEPSESTKLTKAARGYLEALRREFERCSHQYPPVYHEMYKPSDSLTKPEDIPKFRTVSS